MLCVGVGIHTWTFLVPLNQQIKVKHYRDNACTLHDYTTTDTLTYWLTMTCIAPTVPVRPVLKSLFSLFHYFTHFVEDLSAVCLWGECLAVILKALLRNYIYTVGFPQTTKKHYSAILKSCSLIICHTQQKLNIVACVTCRKYFPIIKQKDRNCSAKKVIERGCWYP